MDYSSREFKTDMSIFFINTRNRVFKELLVLIVISGVLFSSIAFNMPLYGKLLIIIIAASYIIYGIIGYSKAKSAAENIRIRLTDSQLEFLGVKGFHSYSYGDLSIRKVKKAGDSVQGILLSIKNSGDQWVTGFENMDVIHKLLAEKIMHKNEAI